mmetsp:Transcript_10916/g.67440  ORF Transcript_10916/g.67440 Transcript_10916/m.67440 type:complete len:477 (+) Transcript_10916:2400-3830(+)
MEAFCLSSTLGSLCTGLCSFSGTSPPSKFFRTFPRLNAGFFTFATGAAVCAFSVAGWDVFLWDWRPGMFAFLVVGSATFCAGRVAFLVLGALAELTCSAAGVDAVSCCAGVCPRSSGIVDPFPFFVFFLGATTVHSDELELRGGSGPRSMGEEPSTSASRCVGLALSFFDRSPRSRSASSPATSLLLPVRTLRRCFFRFVGFSSSSSGNPSVPAPPRLGFEAFVCTAPLLSRSEADASSCLRPTSLGSRAPSTSSAGLAIVSWTFSSSSSFFFFFLSLLRPRSSSFTRACFASTLATSPCFFRFFVDESVPSSAGSERRGGSCFVACSLAPSSRRLRDPFFARFVPSSIHLYFLTPCTPSSPGSVRTLPRLARSSTRNEMPSSSPSSYCTWYSNVERASKRTTVPTYHACSSSQNVAMRRPTYAPPVSAIADACAQASHRVASTAFPVRRSKGGRRDGAAATCAIVPWCVPRPTAG